MTDKNYAFMHSKDVGERAVGQSLRKARINAGLNRPSSLMPSGHLRP
jgi:hypothetical protein